MFVTRSRARMSGVLGERNARMVDVSRTRETAEQSDADQDTNARMENAFLTRNPVEM